MKYTKLFIGLMIFFLFGVLQAVAQGDIISAKEFKVLRKENKELVVVDCRKAKKYAKNHLKGAINISYKTLTNKEPYSGAIKSPEELAKLFGDKGISETTPVVLYDGGKQKYSSRVYWTLKYLGAHNVKILHKDMKEWGKVRLPLSSTPTAPLPAVTFTPSVNDDILVDIDFVKAYKDDPNFVLVDLRVEAQYKGIDEKKKSKGHIPGAVNVPFTSLIKENGAFKSKEEIQKLIEGTEITSDKTIIVYCNTGILASLGYVVAKNIMEWDNVKLYDGGYKQWILENAVEK